MNLFDQPISPLDAVRILQAKSLLPTDLSSDQLRLILAAIRRQAIFSARTLMTNILQEYKNVIGSILQPEIVERPDRVTPENPMGKVTVGHNPATARAEIKRVLAKTGYKPKPDETGTIKDLSSDGRIDLVVDTNVKLANGAGRFVRDNQPGVVANYPAWELVRYEAREVPRGLKRESGGLLAPDPGNSHEARWRAAAKAAGDDRSLAVLEKTGRMVALKSSGLWQALGDGAGGYQDSLGNPFSPFWFRTGMNVENKSLKETRDLGLLLPGETPALADFDFASLFKPPPLKEAA